MNTVSNPPMWFKSSYSGSNGSSCVEVAALPDTIMVRDTKDRTGPVLRFSAEDWRAFTDSLKG
jgi:hypothetical protein